MDAAVHAAAAPLSSIPTAADKGKAPMVDDSLPVDLLSKQERVLKNLHNSQLGEDEGGGDFVSSPQSNEAPQTPAATATGGAENSAALTALSLKLDRCIHRVTTLEN
uniref:Uncharacterized protein n=1 Tax=Tanacetum cinerariifolium TaxID=118510 RepID=A0A699TSZ3_TANCI|nr:hypothetical protein [Tanacetum cinerariifolium]